MVHRFHNPAAACARGSVFQPGGNLTQVSSQSETWFVSIRSNSIVFDMKKRREYLFASI